MLSRWEVSWKNTSENGKRGLAVHTQNDPHLPLPQIMKLIICSPPESPIPRRAAFAAGKRQGGTRRSRGKVVLLHATKKRAALSPQHLFRVSTGGMEALTGRRNTLFPVNPSDLSSFGIHSLPCWSFPFPSPAPHTPDCNNSRDTIWG